MIFLKARQAGLSTLSEAIIYAMTSRKEAFNSMIIADDDEGSKALFEMSKLFYESEDPFHRPEIEKSNEIALSFGQLKSKMFVETARNKAAGRKHTLHAVHLSEVSRFPYPKEIKLGIFNAVPDLPDTFVFMESTAHGLNDFYDDCQAALNGKNGYELIFIPWFYEPGYKLAAYNFKITEEEAELVKAVSRDYNVTLSNDQLNWRRYAIEHKCGGSLELFHQEYPTFMDEAFLASGRPRFNVHKLVQMRQHCKHPLRQDGLLDIYKDPHPNTKYVIGVDTSEGLVTGDNSCAVILDTKRYEVVAGYSGKMAPDIFADYLKDWGKVYNDALIVVEDNNHGLAVLNDLKKVYSNIYYRKTFDKIAEEWTRSIGWRTSSRTKPILVAGIDKAIRGGDLSIPIRECLNELITYIINDDGTTSAPQGKHDDWVMALGCAIQGYLESFNAVEEKKEKLPSYCYALIEQEMMEEQNG